MTNKEAKEKLYREWQGFLEENVDYSRVSEAYKMSIEALEQQPCEDAISRQAAIGLVSTMYLGNDSNSSYRTDGDTGDTLVGKFQVIDGLSDLPAVIPQQKVGQWIKEEKEFIVPSRFYPVQEIVSTCSTCNAHYIGVHEDFKYCPNCGTKMQEV